MMIEPQSDFHNTINACELGAGGGVTSIVLSPNTTTKTMSMSDAFTATARTAATQTHGKHVRVSPDDPFARKTMGHKRLRSSIRVTFDLTNPDFLDGSEQAREEYHQEVLVSEDPPLADLWIGNEGKRRAKAVVQHFKKALAEQQRAEHDDTTTTSPPPSFYLHHFQQALTITQSDGKLDSHLVRSISMDSPARGLEHYILPNMNQSRRRVVKMILRAQSRLPPHTNPEQKAFLLREVSKNLSKPSRRIAQLLGIGDAKVLVDMLLSDTNMMACHNSTL
jgi:hypothetical protein